MQRINKFPNPRFSLNGALPAWNVAAVFPCGSLARPCQRSTSLQPGFEVVA